MNDKDKEEYDKWLESQNWHYDSFDNEYYQNGLKVSIYGETEEAWQSACEYKQKEIDELKTQDQIIAKEIKTYMTIAENLRTVVKINQAENAKLRECVDWYADEANQIAPVYDPTGKPGADFTQPYRMDSGKRARQVLKELEEK